MSERKYVYVCVYVFVRVYMHTYVYAYVYVHSLDLMCRAFVFGSCSNATLRFEAAAQVHG